MYDYVTDFHFFLPSHGNLVSTLLLSSIGMMARSSNELEWTELSL